MKEDDHQTLGEILVASAALSLSAEVRKLSSKLGQLEYVMSQKIDHLQASITALSAVIAALLDRVNTPPSEDPQIDDLTSQVDALTGRVEDALNAPDPTPLPTPEPSPAPTPAPTPAPIPTPPAPDVAPTVSRVGVASSRAPAAQAQAPRAGNQPAPSKAATAVPSQPGATATRIAPGARVPGVV